MNNEEIMEEYKRYREYEYIDLKKKFGEKGVEILRKLKIQIEDKLYTEREFELKKMDLVKYFNKDELGNIIFDEEKTDNELIRNCGVSSKEFWYIIERVDKIEEYYNI